jgi:hypothetical protein
MSTSCTVILAPVKMNNRKTFFNLKLNQHLLAGNSAEWHERKYQLYGNLSSERKESKFALEDEKLHQ